MTNRAFSVNSASRICCDCVCRKLWH